MTRTIAEVLREEGREEGIEQGRQQDREEGAVRALQQALLDSVRTKFGRVPRQMEKAIRAARDEDQLHTWLVQTANATTLQGIEIVPP